MRRLTVLVWAGMCVLVAGCGGSHRAAAASSDNVVNSASCASFGLAGQPTTQRCTFVLDDGRRLGCNRSFAGPSRSVRQLLRAGCHWLTPLKLSRPVRVLIARIDGVKSCLESKRLRASGGALLPPNPSGPDQPDGEIVVTSGSPSFIAFYSSVARARGLEPAVLRTAARSHVQVERLGAVTIAWTQPAGPLRDTVWTCISG
jgi:hypothetical protein